MFFLLLKMPNALSAAQRWKREAAQIIYRNLPHPVSVLIIRPALETQGAVGHAAVVISVTMTKNCGFCRISK